MLQFLYGEGVVCEARLDTDGVLEFGNFLELLMGHITDFFEGNLATQIHNPTIYYFLQILAITIFFRENTNKINDKELLFILSIFKPTRVNSDLFTIAHVQAVGTSKKGYIGGLITSIAHALDLDTELATLEP